MLNRELYDNGRNERMVTASFVRLDFETMRGELVAAGHPRMICLDPGAFKVTEVLALGTVLGVQDEVTLDVREFELIPGQRLFLYTDGLVNAGWVDGPSGMRHRIGDAGLDRMLVRHGSCSLVEQVDNVWNDIMRFCRYKKNDDMLLFGLEIPERKQH